MVGGDAFQAANRNWLVLNTTAPTGRFARSVANTAENAGKHIGFAVLHVGIGELALRDHANVGRHVGMCGAAPLAIDNLMEVVGVGRICGFHAVGHARVIARDLALA